MVLYYLNNINYNSEIFSRKSKKSKENPPNTRRTKKKKEKFIIGFCKRLQISNAFARL